MATTPDNPETYEIAQRANFREMGLDTRQAIILKASNEAWGEMSPQDRLAKLDELAKNYAGAPAEFKNAHIPVDEIARYVRDVRENIRAVEAGEVSARRDDSRYKELDKTEAFTDAQYAAMVVNRDDDNFGRMNFNPADATSVAVIECRSVGDQGGNAFYNVDSVNISNEKFDPSTFTLRKDGNDLVIEFEGGSALRCVDAWDAEGNYYGPDTIEFNEEVPSIDGLTDADLAGDDILPEGTSADQPENPDNEQGQLSNYDAGTNVISLRDMLGLPPSAEIEAELALRNQDIENAKAMEANKPAETEPAVATSVPGLGR